MVKKSIEEKKTIQHLFRVDKIKDKEREGWKVIEKNGRGDLVLMEK